MRRPALGRNADRREDDQGGGDKSRPARRREVVEEARVFGSTDERTRRRDGAAHGHGRRADGSCRRRRPGTRGRLPEEVRAEAYGKGQ
jgi:hypothetical protein